MHLSLQRLRGSHHWIGATLFVTLLYLGLQNVEMALMQAADRQGWLSADRETSLADEARRVAARSEALEAQLPPAHGQMAWRLGLRLGYATELLGSVARSEPDKQRAAEHQVAGMLEEASQLAKTLGVGPVAVLPSRTVGDFGNLRLRIERDEVGLGARIEERVTPRARHLFVVGMHVGSALSDFSQSGGIITEPLAGNEIARHSVLAGVPESLWRPLAFVTVSDKNSIMTAYKPAMEAFDAFLGAP